jgi:hypothetical protein
MGGLTHNQYIICSGKTLADKLDGCVDCVYGERQAGRKADRLGDLTRRGGGVGGISGKDGIRWGM